MGQTIETESAKRGKGWQKIVVQILAVTLCGFLFWTTIFGRLPNIQHRAIVLFICFAMGFILFPGSKKSNGRIPWYDWLLIIGTFAACLHVYIKYWDFMLDPATPEVPDLILGLFLLFAILELSRRCIGWTFAILLIAFVAYAIFGHLIPGRLGHGGTRWQMLVDMLYLTTDGIWGLLMSMFVSLLSLFIIFSSFMMSTGAGNVILDMSKLIGGRMRGGPAKIAVLSSAMMGSITGSSVTNVAMTGNFTIPMMKRMGYRPEVAAGIEATASSGGQITPPLMGAGLFLMAEFLEMEVTAIMLCALIPAILFYVGVLSSVHFDSAREKIASIPAEEIPKLHSFLKYKAIAPVLFPFGVLVGGIIKGYSVDLSIIASVFALLAAYLLTVRSFKDLKEQTKIILSALADTAKPLVSMCALICAAGLLIGVIGYVGIGVKFSEIVIRIGGGLMWPTLILSAIVTIVIGMGIPTTAAYVLASSVISIVFQKLGVGELEAHMFIFYFAALSAITPPVCTAVFVAASIADANWVKVAFHTVRFAMIKYLMPFLFVSYPALLLRDHPFQSLQIMLVCIVATSIMSASLSGYLFSNLKIWERAVLLTGSLMMLWPEAVITGIGLVLIVVSAGWNWRCAKAGGAAVAKPTKVLEP